MWKLIQQSTMNSIFRYTRVPDENEEKDQNSKSELSAPLGNSRKIIISLFVASICLSLFSVGILTYSITANPTDSQCVKQLSPYSPALEAVEYEWRTYANEFEKESIYRGTPTPELEKAWEDLWQFGVVGIDEEKVQLLNKSSSDSWRILPESAGGGVAGFLEVFHQVHCLNLIRQYTYREVWDYSAHPSFSGPKHLLRTHVDHCIETIRLNLMCIGDVTPVLVKHDATSVNKESPDFNTLHKCRKFDKLQEWTRDHVKADKLEKASHHH